MAEPAGPDADMAYASPSSRLVAYLVDALLLTVILSLAAVLLGAFRGPVVRFQPLPETGGTQVSVDRGAALVVAVMSAALSALYFIAAWATGPWTPGQRLLGIRVGRPRGHRLTIGQAAARWSLLMGPISLGSWVGLVRPGSRTAVNLFALAWYLVLFVTTVRSPTRQGLHDRLAGSVVTRGASLHRAPAS